LKPFGPAWPSCRAACRQTAVDVAVEDRLLVVAVLGQTLDFLALDRHRTLVLLDAVAVEDAHFDDRAEGSRRHRSEVSRTSEAFSPKMARRSFSSGVIGLSPFGVILPTRMSPGPLRHRYRRCRPRRGCAALLPDVRNVAGDLFRAELGVAGHHLEFLDVDRGEDVVAHDALGDQDRVLEVVAVPRHERDEHVRPSASSPRSVDGPSAMMSPLRAHRRQSPADAG
jgi:hypothetical protein